MRLELTPDAQREIDEAIAWYEARQLETGEEFYQAVMDALSAIEPDPQRFPPSEYAPSDRDIRQALVQRFPYSIIYEIKPDAAYVVAVAHGSRRPGYWSSRRPSG